MLTTTADSIKTSDDPLTYDTSLLFDSETEARPSADHEADTYSRFILATHYMTWKKDGSDLTKPTAFDPELTAAPAFLRLHLYGAGDTAEALTALTNADTANTLGPNKACLLLRTDRISDPLWQTAGGGARQWAAIAGVSEFTETSECSERSTTFYNLRGQAVDSSPTTLRQGIYVRGGRKVVVK